MFTFEKNDVWNQLPSLEIMIHQIPVVVAASVVVVVVVVVVVGVVVVVVVVVVFGSMIKWYWRKI